MLQEITIDDNNLAFHQTMGNSYQLNEVSKDIIEELKLGKSKEEIVEIISNKYEISPEEAFIDIGDFFSKLKIYGLIQ